MIVRKSVNRITFGTEVCSFFFYLLCYWAFLETMDSWLGKLGVRLLRTWSFINAAILPHSPPGLSLYVEYHFVSDPGPRNDQRLAGHLFANEDASVEGAIVAVSLTLLHHMTPLNTDTKIIRPWNCSGSPILLMSCWTSWTSCNVVNLGKYSTRIPSVSVNCLQSSVLWWIFEPIQLSLPKQYLMFGSDSSFQDITQNLRVHKLFCMRETDDFFIIDQRLLFVSIKNFPSWFETPKISSDCFNISCSDISNICFWVRFSLVFLMECKLSE